MNFGRGSGVLVVCHQLGFFFSRQTGRLICSGVLHVHNTQYQPPTTPTFITNDNDTNYKTLQSYQDADPCYHNCNLFLAEVLPWSTNLPTLY